MYVSKSRVLGVIVDEDLSFEPHAKNVLKNCWYSWTKLTENTSRKRGLNTSSLLILFKTVVLTKLLYASPIWLNDNLDIFKQFMAKAILKIIGAQFYPPKAVSEMLLGLPPLELMNNKVTIKFILKCLFQKDDVTSKIFQIEATPQHHYYKQTILVKEFLKTKFNDIGPLHSMSLNDIDNNRFLYSKDEMTNYTCALWDKLIKEDMFKQSLLKTRIILRNSTRKKN